MVTIVVLYIIIWLHNAKFNNVKLISATLMTGCLSVSDFSETSESFDFDALSKENYDAKDSLWNQKTEFEYFIEVKNTNEDELFKAITDALISMGYKVSYSDKSKRAIIGTRGLRPNEWRSISGVYYRPASEGFHVYIKNRITQDITGGWRENRSKKIADTICSLLKKGE